jgi:hypothetical protein
MNAKTPLPLRMRITDRTQPFRLRFAQEASAVLAGFTSIKLEATGIGLKGASERDRCRTISTVIPPRFSVRKSLLVTIAGMLDAWEVEA